MAMTIQQIHPVAPLPLVLGVLRRLEVATLIDDLIPPHPAHGLSCGRGVEALVLAILDGHHALYKVGRRLEERGMLALLQPGLTRAALNDYRLGHILDALFAANLNRVFSAVALKALEVYAIPTPWLHQDTTTLALYGVYCEADGEAAIAEYEHRGPGQRGRRPQAWRYHAVRYRVVADTRRTRRARRGRPAKTDPPPTEAGYRLVVEVEASTHPEEDKGWTVLATTVSAEVCTDAQILQAYQEQNTTVEPGFRWIKNPAAIAPVWLEKPERIAALAMLTVLGLLVYSVIQRQVRLYLRTHAQQLPGNKGLTATPTAAVVLALFTQVALVQLWVDEHEVTQISGVQPYHLLVCDALGLDSSWYEASSAPKNGKDIQTP
jgi:transposase